VSQPALKIAVPVILAFISAANARAQTLSSLKHQPSARDIVKRIQEHVGVPWQKETVDTFKAGDPDIKITGVAVTMMATFDVLQRAAASGQNLVITHEPTFYNHEDRFDQLPQKENDEVLAGKLAFIKEHHLVIWRFHDHWHARNPDGIEAGMAHALFWEAFQDKQNQYLFTIPETTVAQLAQYFQTRLHINVMRVVGDPTMKVSRVALSPGSAGMTHEITALEIPDVQVLVTGESREWETVEYVADAVTEKKKKALIILSHIPSEQAGMEECTRWLKLLVPEVPVEFVPAAQPFWTSDIPAIPAGHSTMQR
jgi:putative NIF3 family GTP cyclohydrolase 1 type 2